MFAGLSKIEERTLWGSDRRRSSSVASLRLGFFVGQRADVSSP